jgi:hypothetical protein
VEGDSLRASHSDRANERFVINVIDQDLLLAEAGIRNFVPSHRAAILFSDKAQKHDIMAILTDDFKNDAARQYFEDMISKRLNLATLSIGYESLQALAAHPRVKIVRYLEEVPSDLKRGQSPDARAKF